MKDGDAGAAADAGGLVAGRKRIIIKFARVKFIASFARGRCRWETWSRGVVGGTRPVRGRQGARRRCIGGGAMYGCGYRGRSRVFGTMFWER